MDPVAHLNQAQVGPGEFGLAADGDAGDPLAGRRELKAPEAVARRPPGCAATIFSTRSSSLGRPAASGVECHSANPLSTPPSRTRVVSPMPRSRVSASSRVKSTPGKTRSASCRHSSRRWFHADPAADSSSATPTGAARYVMDQRDGHSDRAPGRSGCRTRCYPPSGASSPDRWWWRPGTAASRCRSGPWPSPRPSPWRSGRTASGPIQPSVPERCTMLNATMLPVGVAPDHRAVAGVLEGVAPDQVVQLRDPHAHQPVPAVAVGERVGEDPVERIDVAQSGPVRASDAPVRPPHRGLPAARRAPWRRRLPHRRPRGRRGRTPRAPNRCG